MAGYTSYEDDRLFIGGLSRYTTSTDIQNAFRGFILRMIWLKLDEDTGRCLGFGFVTLYDERDTEDAIREMDGRKIRGSFITVNRARRKMTGGRGYSSCGRGSYGGNRDFDGNGCYNCGRSGHWARECPYDGADDYGDNGRFPSQSRFLGGSDGGGDFQDHRFLNYHSDDQHELEGHYNSYDQHELQGKSVNPKPAVSACFCDVHSVEGGSGDMAAQDAMATKIGGFPVPNKYALLYKAVYKRHGHIATKRVIKSSTKALVALVTDILDVISGMKETSFADLSASLLKHWDLKVATAEAVEFNVGWLREKIDELKAEFSSTKTLQSSLEDDEELLKVTREEFVAASKALETLRMQLVAAENHSVAVERRLKACRIKVETQVAEKERKAAKQHQPVLTGLL